ncbi:hypothetical protein [Flavobacterium sp.]|uniref:hypothetical protein n=1 Tax=Flavobacterium sp. TaxID=239 RepID=UPI0039E63291
MTKTKGVYVGKIEQDEKGNYFCGPYLLDFKTVHVGKFKIGDEVNLKSVIANPSDASLAKYEKKSRDFSLVKDNPDPKDPK